jgi:site-specific DNA-methyltransferase (adenine-specific)
MAGMDPESVDAVVTDPPYGLEFMGVAWDTMRDDGKPRTRNEWGDFGSREHARGPHDLARVQAKKGLALQAFTAQWAEAAFRVAKPSAYLLAFGGTRTVHRMTCAIEDAGWIVRDMLVWAYASGFPKSKASLKPAWEPIVMARKPGPLRMLNIDECRIPGADGDGHWSGDDGSDATSRPGFDGGFTKGGKRERFGGGAKGSSGFAAGYEKGDGFVESTAGRWPANVILSDEIFEPGVDGVVIAGSLTGTMTATRGQSGGFAIGYSRFFLIPKAARSDREPVLGGLPLRAFGQSGGAQAAMTRGEEYQTSGASTGLNVVKQRANVHPTVKPVDLMRHLVRLVTPTGGTVLDPFAGSGSTLLAAEMEGFAWLGIEREAEYVAIAEARLNGTQRGMAL